MRIAKKRLIGVCAVLALTQGGLRSAMGQQVTATWSSFGTGDWNTAGNWNPSGVPNSVSAVVGFFNDSVLAVNISSGVSAQTLYFDNATGSYNLTSGAGVALSGLQSIIVGPNVAGNTAINLNNNSNGSLLFASGGNLTIINNASSGSLIIGPNTQIGTPGNGGVVFSGSAATVLSGTFASNVNNAVVGGLIKTGPGSLDYQGNGTSLSGGINTSGGTLSLDYSNNTASKLNGGALTMSGGLVTLISNSTTPVAQTIPGGTVAAAGEDVINASGTGSVTLGAGAVTQLAGATLDFRPTASGPAFAITTSTGNTNGLLGVGPAFATVSGGANWAMNSSGAVVAVTSYGTNIYSAGTNTDVTVAGSQAGITTNSLRFNTGAITLGLGGINTIQSGGILVTPSSAGGTISGGTISATGNGEIIVQQYSNSPFTISSAIQTSVGLTKSGPGELILTNANDALYLQGTININRGNLLITTTSAVNGVGAIKFNDGRSLANLQQFIVQQPNGTSGSINPPIQLSAFAPSGSYGTIFGTGTSTSTVVTLGGVLSSAPGLTTPVQFLGTSDDSNEFDLTAANTFTGNISLDQGTLGINSDASLGNASNTLFLQVSDDTIGGLVFLNSGINVAHAISITFDTRVVSNGTDSNTISGQIGGTLALVKDGTGNLILSNTANTWTGGLTINSGTVSISNGGNVGASSPVSDNSVLSCTATLTLANPIAMGSIGGTITVPNSGTTATLSNTITGPGILNVTGSGTLALTGAGSTFGSLNISSNSTVTATNLPSTLTSIDLTSGTLKFNGSSATVTTAVGLVTLGTIAVQTAGQTLTLSGTVNGSELIKSGSGVLNLALTGSSNISEFKMTAGTTVVSSGTLGVYNNTATLAVGVLSGASFQISGGAVVTAEADNGDDVVIDGNGSVLVTGAGSQLIPDYDILVGNTGAGSLNISNGGSVTAPLVFPGNQSGGVGNIFISGTGSTLNALGHNGFSLELGNGSSTGTVTILNGGTANAYGSGTQFDSNSSSINVSGGTLNTQGLNSLGTGNGSIILTDPAGGFALNINDPNTGDSLTYSGTISGTGSLNESGGSTEILAGNNTFTGSVLVTGGTLALSGSNSFSKLNISSGGILQLNPGGSFPGTTPITLNGGTFSYNTGAGALANAINITSAGGTISIPSAVTLVLGQGITGPGGLTLSGPGFLETSSSGNTFGSLTLTSNGYLESFNLPATLSGLTFDGGTLQYSGTAAVTTPTFVTANSGTILVTGTGALTLSGSLNGPSGTLTIPGPGTVNFSLTNSSSNTLFALLSNGGITQITSGALSIAESHDDENAIAVRHGAVLNISGGAVVTATSSDTHDVVVDGSSTINVSGPGSVLTSPGGGELYVGLTSGSNSLTVTNGGQVGPSSLFLVVGGESSGTSGSANVSSGGTVTAGYCIFGNEAQTTGTATIGGGGATLSASASLELGGNNFDDLYGGTGSITVSNGGTVNAGTTIFYSNSSSINVSGGIFNSGSLTSSNTGYGSITLTDPAGGYALNINDATAADSNTYSGTISGTGSLNYSGGATQILSGTDTFTGRVLTTGGTLALGSANSFTSLNISGGTLQINPNGSFPAATPITLNGGTFSYNAASATLTNPVNLTANGGTIQIPTAATTLTTTGLLNGPSGTLTTTGTGTLNLALSSSSSNSLGVLNPSGGTTQITSGALSLASTNTALTLANGASFNISGGAVVTATESDLLLIQGASFASVSGTGSQLNAIASGAVIDVGGFDTASSGSLSVTLGGAVSANSFLSIGDLYGSGSGTLIISSGGTATVPTAVLGGHSGATGTATVNGSGSVLTAPSALELGGFNFATGGTGILVISTGGTVNAGTTEFLSNSSSINISGGTLNTGSLYSYTTGLGSITLADPAGGVALNINGSSGTVSYSGTISGTGSLNKSGGSTQMLAGTDTYTGLTLVIGGKLVLAGTNHLGSMNISIGTVQVTGNQNVLSLTGLTIGSTGKLDLTTDAADISGGTLAGTNAFAKAGYNNGLWTGTGLTSSNASSDAKHLTAVGVIQNNQSGTALYNASHQFLSITPGASDILAAYTYYGDTNLDGKIDGADYSRIDSAYLADRSNPFADTGWFNGDFNYDGTVEGSDYTLMDNAYNTQTAVLDASIAAQVGGTATVPEPTTAVLLGAARSIYLGGVAGMPFDLGCCPMPRCGPRSRFGRSWHRGPKG